MSAKVYCDGWQSKDFKCANEAIYCTECAIKFSEVEHHAELAALYKRITDLEQAVSEARELLTQPQGADWDEQVEAWLAYYAEKEKYNVWR